LGVEEYNKLKAEQITLEAEVTRLNNIAADARADKHPEELKLAEEALQRNKDAIEYHREAEEKLTQDIEARSNTINNLKDNLQALIDKYDLLDTTMSAGVQSMTSGLSSIFSDWASGVIQNTEDVRDAFEALGKSVLQSMAKVVSDRIAQQFMGFILNGLGSMFGGSGEINLGMETQLTDRSCMLQQAAWPLPSGVKHFARGGEVTGTNIGRDSVAALLI
jgi:DNA-binding protein H-NS